MTGRDVAIFEHFPRVLADYVLHELLCIPQICEISSSSVNLQQEYISELYPGIRGLRRFLRKGRKEKDKKHSDLEIFVHAQPQNPLPQLALSPEFGKGNQTRATTAEGRRVARTLWSFCDTFRWRHIPQHKLRNGVRFLKSTSYIFFHSFSWL
jgi:hypothetical protein